MKRVLLIAALALLIAGPAKLVSAHCQVPCGIYDDQRRFEELLEDYKTIAKAQAGIAELSGKHDPQSLNQLIRWVTTKEAHASNAQKVIGDYFMAQRIKADSEKYTVQLKAAHKIIVTAMKSKQSADPETAKALQSAIYEFYEAYEGKKPDFDHEH
ncbi:MAG: superoxide dismutase [Ni] [Pirellulales bacterium]|jgi:nickel superoxide dismutase